MFNVKFSSCLGIYTGTLSCIVKPPDEVCASHTKRVGDNKTILQLKNFAEALFTGLSFKNISKRGKERIFNSIQFYYSHFIKYLHYIKEKRKKKKEN